MDDPTELENGGGFKGEIRVIPICPGVWTYGSESIAERMVFESALELAEEGQDVAAEIGGSAESQ